MPELDQYLLRQAGQDARRRVATPFVWLDQDGRIAGYYTLSAYSVLATELPDHLARKLPRYPLLPAILLGRLAVSRSHQGQHLGRLLLTDALLRSWYNTKVVASVGVVVEAYDDAARSFYQHHEFTTLADHPHKVFISMMIIENAARST